jgi:serine/alanine adding enzyme
MTTPVNQIRREAPMMARVSDAVAETDWNAFVATHPLATGYHQWQWRRVFEEAFGHQSLYLAASSADRIVGILPLVLFRSRIFGRFAVSVPFLNYGGVIADSESVARALLDSAIEHARAHALAHIELRHVTRQFDHLPVKQHKVAMRLALPSDAETLWKGIDRKARNLIRKSEKGDLRASVGGVELLPEFYRVFAHNMRDLGTPVYPRRFFEIIFGQFPDTARIIVVRSGTIAVAAAVTVRWRDSIEVPWAASLREYLSLSPNMLLYWTMLQEAVRGGCTVFDFGRSTPGEGTYQFKRQWGAEATPYAWEYALLEGGEMPDQSPKNPKFQLAIEVWKRLPVPIATWLGPSIVRSIP